MIHPRSRDLFTYAPGSEEDACYERAFRRLIVRAPALDSIIDIATPNPDRSLQAIIMKEIHLLSLLSVRFMLNTHELARFNSQAGEGLAWFGATPTQPSLRLSNLQYSTSLGECLCVRFPTATFGVNAALHCPCGLVFDSYHSQVCYSRAYPNPRCD
jgi:hypothetical protein